MNKPKWCEEHDHGGPSVVHVYRVETDRCMEILGAVTERDGGWFWFPDLVDTQLDTETMKELLEIQKEEISGESDYTMTVGPFVSLEAAKRCGELMGRQKFKEHSEDDRLGRLRDDIAKAVNRFTEVRR